MHSHKRVELTSREREESAVAHDRSARKHDKAAASGGDKAAMHEVAAAWRRACRDAHGRGASKRVFENRDGRACASRRTEEVGSWLGR